ncbi:MAG: hypothetical protein R6V36_08025 [Psychroflexus sp.]
MTEGIKPTFKTGLISGFAYALSIAGFDLITGEAFQFRKLIIHFISFGLIMVYFLIPF